MTKQKEGEAESVVEAAVKLRVNVRINLVRQYDMESLDELTYFLALDGYDLEDYDIISVETAV